MDFSIALKNVLRKDQKVGIPGLGTLSVVKTSAWYDENTREMHPPVETYRFEEDKDVDYTPFEEEFKSIEPGKAAVMDTLINVEKGIWQNRLYDRKESLLIDNLGTFYWKNGEVHFKSIDAIMPEDMDLPVITLGKRQEEPIEVKKPEPPAKKVETKKITEKKYQEKKTGMAWYWWLIIFFLFLAALAYVMRDEIKEYSGVEIPTVSNNESSNANINNQSVKVDKTSIDSLGRQLGQLKEGEFNVVVAALENVDSAHELADKLYDDGFKTVFSYYDEDKGLNRVIIKSFKTKDSAVAFVKQIKPTFPDAWILEATTVE